MKKILFIALALLCAMPIMAQEVKTHSVYDVNQSGDVTVEDVTTVVDQVKKNVAAAQTQQYVTADDLSVLLKSILDDLKLIKEKLGIIPDPYNGHEYVDLGLPSGVKWATCNVGADNPEDYGDYYAWGETETKSTYEWSTYKWCNGLVTTLTKYCNSYSYGTVDNKATLDPEDDVARVKWGGDWRMPTKAEQDELRDTNNCTWIWTTQGGKNGYLVTSKKNGNSIFLPASGYRFDSYLYDAGSYGGYWSSSLGTSYSYGAYELYFSDYVSSNDSSRHLGFSVRPVCP